MAEVVMCCRLVPLNVANAAGATHTNCPEPVVWYAPEFDPDYPLAYCAKHAPDPPMARWADLRQKAQENSGCIGALPVYPSELLDLFETVDRLHEGLTDALEGLLEMLPYVPDYFVKKWELHGYIDRASKALELDGGA